MPFSTTSTSPNPLSATRDAAEATGRALGPWRLCKKIGEGAAAEVFTAKVDGAIDAEPTHVVKLLRAELQEDDRALRQLASEAALSRKVAHPHVASVVDCQLRNAPHYLVMPFQPGDSLAARWKRGERPGVDEAVWIVRQAAEGLAAIHEAGWIHGDVSPANLFLADDGHVTVLDLGLAREIGRAGRPNDSALSGSLPYMSPEMLTSALAPDHRSDLYSLGVIFFELLTGERPYDGCSPAEVLRWHRERPAERLIRSLPHLPRRAYSIVRSLLAGEPLRRPHSSAALAAQLVRLEIEMFGLSAV